MASLRKEGKSDTGDSVQTPCGATKPRQETSVLGFLLQEGPPAGQVVQTEGGRGSPGPRGGR